MLRVKVWPLGSELAVTCGTSMHSLASVVLEARERLLNWCPDLRTLVVSLQAEANNLNRPFSKVKLRPSRSSHNILLTNVLGY